MSEKSRRSRPNVRIVAKNNQTWAEDWASDPNSYCRAFNARARELGLGLVATPHFPKPNRRLRWLTLAGVIAVVALGCAFKYVVLAPYWTFTNAERNMAIRYPTRVHYWCRALPTHCAHFVDGKEIFGRIVRPQFLDNGSIEGFGVVDCVDNVAVPWNRLRAERQAK